MHKTFIMEVSGRWIVLVEGDGHRQEYVCESYAQAQRWLTLLGSPVRHRDHPAQGHLKARSEA